MEKDMHINFSETAFGSVDIKVNEYDTPEQIREKVIQAIKRGEHTILHRGCNVLIPDIVVEEEEELDL